MTARQPIFQLPTLFGKLLMHNLNLLDVNLFLAKVYSPNHRMIRYYCLRCFDSKSSQELLDEHYLTCSNGHSQVEIYPEEGELVL